MERAAPSCWQPRLGLPISTTHSITGALVGAGVAAAGFSQVQFVALGRGVVMPLLFSPLTIFLALSILALDFMIYVLLKWLYGDRRSLIAHRVAQQRKAAPVRQKPGESTVARDSGNESGKLFSRSSYTTHIA